ncbi:prepilin peptidase [Vagococcus proximus]|uniref:prepilin peptidase n=1 Tax=Vagococcus proximus TaxID=2991417 RepID=UPI003463059A
MIIIIVVIILVGSCLGSFFTVIAERVPIGLSLVSPSSHCPRCKNKLKPLDLIPIFSFLFLKGKCRYCQTKIQLMSTVIECLIPLLFLIFYYTNHLSIVYLPEIIIILTSIILSIMDILYLELSPTIFLLGYGISFVLSYLFYQPIHIHFINALLLYFTFSVISYLSISKIGLGDVKLICFWALTLNINNLVYLLLYATSSALLYILYLYSKKISIQNKKIPFVPFLTFAYIIIFLQ